MKKSTRLAAAAALVGAGASLAALPYASAFAPPAIPVRAATHGRTRASSPLAMADGEPFELMLTLPSKSGDGLAAQMKFPSVVDGPSEVVEVRYSLPFGLNVEPKNNMAVCTADGPGGEKVGDVLRYTSQWTLGLPRGDGAITTAASFAGGISWQCSMFDVLRAGRWEDVVEALTSNVEGRTDEVVLLFERPLPEE